MKLKLILSGLMSLYSLNALAYEPKINSSMQLTINLNKIASNNLLFSIKDLDTNKFIISKAEISNRQTTFNIPIFEAKPTPLKETEVVEEYTCLLDKFSEHHFEVTFSNINYNGIEVLAKGTLSLEDFKQKNCKKIDNQTGISNIINYRAGLSGKAKTTTANNTFIFNLEQTTFTGDDPHHSETCDHWGCHTGGGSSNPLISMKVPVSITITNQINNYIPIFFPSENKEFYFKCYF